MVRKSKRNKYDKQDKILKALGSIVVSQGFDALGINALAKKSKVSKVLIYRYFGSLEGAVEAWIKKYDYWLSPHRVDHILKMFGDGNVNADLLMRELIRESIYELHANPDLQEIRRWEIAFPSKLARYLASRRAEAGRDIAKLLAANTRYDSVATYAIIKSGLIYLLLRAEVSEDFWGIHLSSDEGWSRLLKATNHLLDALFAFNTPTELRADDPRSSTYNLLSARDEFSSQPNEPKTTSRAKMRTRRH